jgi:hemerythrin-like domain-containing protein
MKMIHGYFRLVFSQAPALAQSVAEGDTARAAVVADHLTAIAGTLHSHHHGEDILLWEQLEARNPACAAHVAEMRADHSAMAGELTALEQALPAWRADASAEHRERVLFALSGILALLNQHLGAEERQILPVAAVAFSQQEWDKLGEHGRASVPGNFRLIQLGFILDSLGADAPAWQKANLPAPIRLIWRLIGSRQYAKYHAEVYGTAA